MLRSRYYGYNEGPKLRPTGVSQNSALKMVANAWRINIVINIRRPLCIILVTYFYSSSKTVDFMFQIIQRYTCTSENTSKQQEPRESVSMPLVLYSPCE
jgi:hypothetical protein